VRTTTGKDSASRQNAECNAFLKTAIEKLTQGDAQAALRAASEACHCAPHEPKAHYAYGQAWLALNDPARAERAFADAIRHDPAWADAWVNYGIARDRQGHVEDAKRAMREALARQPGHSAAIANLDAFMRASGGATAGSVMKAVKPADPATALGMAVEFLMKQPVFAGLPFGEWAQVLVGQINRGHFFFAVDEQHGVHGMFGWALTSEAIAEAWVTGRGVLRSEDCRDGDCVIINVLAADNAEADRVLAEEGIKVLAGKRLFFAKRYYRNGRTRPVRMPGEDLGRYFAAIASLRKSAGQSS
jgi:Tfp pilus assembly protein PilF/hemolysin-activating ACP:hemolysin acyltransferase